MTFIGYNELFTCIQFRCPTTMPHKIYQACMATDTVSQTRYIQEAVVARLARDLGVDEAELLDELPPCRVRNKVLFHPEALRRNPGRVGSANTIEEVK